MEPRDATEDSAMTIDVSAPPAFPAERARLSHADHARFLPLVQRIAGRLARRLPSYVELDDLVGFGWVGLAEAVSRAPRSIPMDEFEAFASARVRGAMLDYLRALSPNGREKRNATRRAARAAKAPEANASANDNGTAEVTAMRFHLFDIDDTDLASDTMPTDELAIRSILTAKVAREIERLPSREKQILGLYCQDECTLREIGAILGITESRVSQILTGTVKKLRALTESAA
jgi:RNA polymerase sigma factor for flagellar operon FliA